MYRNNAHPSMTAPVGSAWRARRTTGSGRRKLPLYMITASNVSNEIVMLMMVDEMLTTVGETMLRFVGQLHRGV
jgi:hypothetical protein